MHDDCGCEHHDHDDHRGHHDHGWCEHCGHEECRCHHHHHHHRPIRIGNVTVDCTPVTFRTPGQAMNIVSCPVSETVMVPINQTTNVQVPLGNGCVANFPVTQQVAMPVVTTVNLPPVQTPVPTIVCPGF